MIFLRILDRKRTTDQTIADVCRCRNFAGKFEIQFKSLQCRILRPQGFRPDNLPHLCEPLTCRTIQFSIDFIPDHALGSMEDN
ncbi:MAG: hypothetical protein EHM45_00790 [Desulfobacteraceae bacterium]|nr:MAG: hypothetical protein EHM45_00790 [Desulfobacteraceae bacterium]